MLGRTHVLGRGIVRVPRRDGAVELDSQLGFGTDGRTSVKTMKGAAAWGRLATVMAVGRGEAKAAVSLGSVDGDDERGVGGGP